MPRDLVLTPACRDVRADVGPVAWVVLEELVMSAEDGPRAVEVATTVRDLAAAIGLSKDTIASGLRRLIQHGLVTREDHRDRRSGCFGNSVYRVNLSQTGLRTSSPDGPKPEPGSSDTATAVPKAGPKRALLPRRRDRHRAAIGRPRARCLCRRRRCRCSTPLGRVPRAGRCIDDRQRLRCWWRLASAWCRRTTRRRGRPCACRRFFVGARGACSSASVLLPCGPRCLGRGSFRLAPRGRGRRPVVARAWPRRRVRACGRLGAPLAASPWKVRGHRLALGSARLVAAWSRSGAGILGCGDPTQRLAMRGRSMMGVGKVGGAGGDYYLEAVAEGVDEYFRGIVEAPGQWTGRAAGGLGLDGEVDAEQLRALWAGGHPVT